MQELTIDTPVARPPQLSAAQKRRAHFLLRTLSPRLKRVELVDPPAGLAPFSSFEIERSTSPGHLCATWYPATTTPCGAVLLVHPWVPWGQGYFHRRGRLPALRKAGYHALTFDLSGVGRSNAVPSPDFNISDLEDAFRELRNRAEGLPLHLWGISAGAYWAHLFLSRGCEIPRGGSRGENTICGAVFEDVSIHLLRWSWRKAPWGFPGYLFFQHCWPPAYQFLDLRRHAPLLRGRAMAYIGGERDSGVLPEETRELARLAGAECLIVPGADHLEAIKNAEQEVIALAFDTFRRAEISLRRL